jgi:N6-adenosine-specific RNA methylase IME4
MSGKYRTIVADPPWEYPEGFASGHGRTVKKGKETYSGKVQTEALPYPSMTLGEIAALPVADMAAPYCRLFLWTTNRFLPFSFEIANEWGFTYRQTLVWHKTDANLPAHVAPNSAEFLLVATKGSPPRLETMPSAVIAATRYGGPGVKSHSRKPESFLDYIEQVSPGPYVELFARRARFGWDYWGNESLGTAEMAA